MCFTYYTLHNMSRDCPCCVPSYLFRTVSVQGHRQNTAEILQKVSIYIYYATRPLLLLCFIYVLGNCFDFFHLSLSIVHASKSQHMHEMSISSCPLFCNNKRRRVFLSALSLCALKSHLTYSTFVRTFLLNRTQRVCVDNYHFSCVCVRSVCYYRSVMISIAYVINWNSTLKLFADDLKFIVFFILLIPQITVL